MASAISGSGSSSPNPSIITTALWVLATIRSRSLAAISSAVGKAINRPSTRARRTAPIGPRKGASASMQRGRGAEDRENVGIVLAVGRDRSRLNLDLVAIPVGEERPDRPVDQPGGEDFLGGRASLALDEAAGELARGVGLLAIVDGEREEVEPFAARTGHARDERHGVAQSDDHGPGGLLGESSRLDADRAVADGSLDDLGEKGVLDMNVPR